MEGAWFMQPERLSLYGTPLWEAMTQEQRIELSRHEVASIASVGLWFELILMQMMVRELYDEDPRSERTQYALTEVGDECRHSVMFGRAIERCGAPAYGPTPHIHRLGRGFKTVAGGVSAYASILVAEEILDRWQRELMRDERVQPLTRMVSRVHVLEEARHMTFAREEVERAVPAAVPRAARLAPHGHGADGVHGRPHAGEPGGVRRGGARPGEAKRAALHQPALPADAGVDGGEGRRLPRRAGPDRCRAAAGLEALAADAGRARLSR